MFSRLSIASQFMLLAFLGVALTAAGLGLSLKRSYGYAYEAKRMEIRHEVEEAASILQHYVERAAAGELTTQEAQKRAIESIQAIRFEKTNYAGMTDYDGMMLANGNKAMIGKNVLGLKDAFGSPVVINQLAIAKSGNPGFIDYHWIKPGETTPKLKMAYVIGIPEWRMYVTAGDFAEDLDTTMINNVMRLLEIFVPLFVLYLIVVFVMQRGVGKLLHSLSATMERLARGDLSAEIAQTGRRDEIGKMARTLVGFRQAAVEKIVLQDAAAEARARSEQEAARQEQARIQAAEEQAQVVEGLASGLEKLSAGDLTSRLSVPFAPQYEKLRVDFNAASAKLEETLQVVGDNTRTIRAASVEISSAADDLSRRTEQQAASLEQVAAALDEITATVRKTAQGAGQAKAVASTTKTEAETSGVVVREAVQAMEAIERSSNQIGEIIGVIDEIAFQTSLLALNAGVEAARAGDAGRGFAVVASEVRALAQRSAGAAKEIKTHVAASQREVNTGVRLVGQTGHALGRILVQIADLSGVVTEISASATEQAAGLAEVNTAVNQMDQVTQQNAAMVEQSTAASHSLALETEQLASLIDRFQFAAAC